MSIQQLKLVCALSISAAAMSLAMAADTPHLNVKMGLWEISSRIQVSGMPAIPDEVLQKLAPEQRAKMQAALAGMNSDRPRLMKECMTQERMAQGFKATDRDDDIGCKTTVVTNTSSDMVIHKECSSGDGQSVTTVHFTANGSEAVAGTITSVNTRGGKTMNVDGTISGKWLSADCGSVKDIEPETSTP